MGKAKGNVNTANQNQFAKRKHYDGPKKNHNRKPTKLTVDNGIFGTVNRGRSNVLVAKTHEEQAFAALPRRNKVAEQVTAFRASVHDLASTHPAVANDLQEGSVARVYAEAYLVARRDTRNDTNRVDTRKLAEKLALDQLSGDDLYRVGAITKGRICAQKALDEAFQLVHQAAAQAAAS